MPAHALQPTARHWKLALGQDRVSMRWPTLAGRLQRRWHLLTATDIERATGDTEYLAQLLQRHYGIDRSEALLQVYEFESEL